MMPGRHRCGDDIIKVYVFDIDGVLVDVSERLRRAKELSEGSRELFWKYFFSKELIELDKPRDIGIRLLIDRLKMGLVAIVTGRPKSLYYITLKQLKAINIPIEQIWRIEMRRDGDYRKSYIVKLERILNIVYEGYEIAEIHDDEEELLYRARIYLPKTRLYLHKNDSVIELFSKKLW
ncbi:MAG TPA: hypothetical protein ENG44_01485 [Desulfurococcaceae archaeon]|nr:hypothetical protein [Desulfurococcaceae archaeon]